MQSVETPLSYRHIRVDCARKISGWPGTFAERFAKAGSQSGGGSSGFFMDVWRLFYVPWTAERHP